MNLLNPNSLFVGKVAKFIKNIDSTNSYAKNLLSKSNPIDGTVICAGNQQAGRGQIGSAWQSEADKNLLLSIILLPKFLQASQQFMLSKVVCLAATELLYFLGIDQNDVWIKWPNDLYVGDLKIGGILIENQLKGHYLHNSVIGIGLNINQSLFDPSLANPTSVLLQTGQNNPINIVLKRYCELLEPYYLQLKATNYKSINQAYLERLLGYKKWRYFYLKRTKHRIRAQIIGVHESGQLCLQTEHKQLYCSLKEIVFEF